MMLEQGQRKFEASIFMKIVMVAILFLLPATSSASDDIRELGKAAEKLARAYNVDDTLNDFFFGAFSGRSEIVSGASRSGNSSRRSKFENKAKSRFTFKGLNKLEYKHGDTHRISIEEHKIGYRLTIALW
jgi:hypothetical protein